MIDIIAFVAVNSSKQDLLKNWSGRIKLLVFGKIAAQ
jgi:hypothetical protein